jgi:hypothetical protein
MWDDQERQGKEVKEYYVGGRGGMWGKKWKFAPANVWLQQFHPPWLLGRGDRIIA